ncbi:MAG TPA: hypothetical protein VNS55_03015 [Nocardioides sp.]|nr:hypothetical protein [Nocardioides sp.]
MSALEERIRRGLGADVTVSVDDILTAAAAGAQRSRRQQRWAAGIGAAAAVLAVIVGGIAVSRGNESSAPPVGPSPSPTPSQTQKATDRGSTTYFAAPPDAAGHPSFGEFALVIGRGQSDIYLRRDGELPRRVFSADADERCPSVSPDGAALAYLSGTYRATDNSTVAASVIVVALDSRGEPEPGSERVVFRNASSACPQWSPDGRRLAVAGESEDSTTSGLHVVTLDGKERTLAVGRAQEPVGRAQEPQFAWSPDGDAVAYLTEDSVWIAPLEGGEPEFLWRSTPTPGFKDGGLYATPGAPRSLWWLRSGELAVEVISDRVSDEYPYFPEGPDALHIIDVESGRHQTIELSGNTGAAQVVWSPDGSRFAYPIPPASSILVHDLATGSTVTVRPKLHGAGLLAINDIAWSADGERLLTDAQAGPDSQGGPFALVSIGLDGSVDVLSPWTTVQR